VSPRFTPSGGTFGTYFGNLKRRGYLSKSPRGEVEITPAGLDYLGQDVPPKPETTEELLSVWPRALKAGEWRMLEALLDTYPEALTRDELEERSGFTAADGAFGTYLGTLRRNGLVEVNREQVRASADLFLE
jgi:uncharacterized protein